MALLRRPSSARSRRGAGVASAGVSSWYFRMECATCDRQRYLAETHLTIAGRGDRRVGDLIGRLTHEGCGSKLNLLELITSGSSADRGALCWFRLNRGGPFAGQSDRHRQSRRIRQTVGAKIFLAKRKSTRRRRAIVSRVRYSIGGYLPMSQLSASPDRPREAGDLKDTLRDLVVQQGLAPVLQELAHVMADVGSVTGGIVSEVGAIEAWLATQQQQ